MEYERKKLNELDKILLKGFYAKKIEDPPHSSKRSESIG